MRPALKTLITCFVFAAVCLPVLTTASTASAQDSVIQAPVNDYAGVIPEPVEAHVNEKLRAHYEKTGVQMAVLLVDSTGKMPIEELSLKVAEEWEGGRAGEDRGVLLTLAIQDRRSRLEIGYGLETVIPDSMAASMLASIRPELHGRNYDRAVRDAVDAVMVRTDQLRPGERPSPFSTSPFWRLRYGFWAVLMLGILLSLTLWLLHDWDVGKLGSRPGLWGGLIAGAIALVLALLTMQIAPFGYVLVYCVGLFIGLYAVNLEGWRRLVPLLSMLALAGAWFGVPWFHALLVGDINNRLLAGGVIALALTIVPLEGVRIPGRTFGGLGSSSGSTGGGYSGGGGGFGGGGASGGW